MARKTLTDKGVKALKPGAKLYHFADPQMPGHYVRVLPSGAKTFAVIARGPSGKQVLASIGTAAMLTIDEARAKARATVAAIKAGADKAGPQTFAAVAENWFRRHVESKGLRSKVETRRYLDKWILPAWSQRAFTAIKRGDVAALLDAVEDKAGAVAADNALKRVSAICAWYQSRHDDYVSPVVRGMRRSNTKERARTRILTDDEIRAVWKQAEANGTFGAMVRLLLLTAQRREKVAAMRWQDIAIDSTWTIPAEAREKGNALELVLPDAALVIIKAQPRFTSNPYVFAGRGNTHFSGYSKAKAAFDAKTSLPHWQLHDLRRTARSLMSRAHIRPDIAERVLGHAIKGVEGVYDRHSYREEKAHALNALAGLIDSILSPQDAKVSQLRGYSGN
jgi:integrase